MLSQFFIRRPIFATVLSAVITLAGALAVFFLPIAQYPDITPPTVEVTASYPGANAQLVFDTVAAPIEQQVNGVENMLYMSSQCTNDGKYTLTTTFALGTDLNVAQVLVQNRVQLAMPVIPSIVQQEGVAVKKKSPNIMMIVNLVSKKDARGKYISDDLTLSNYATIQIKDELLRLPGVGDVTFLGQRDYSMRAWLDPEKLASRNMTASDVSMPSNEQNIQVAAGQVGQQPVPDGQNFQLTMSTLGRLMEPEQFGGIILKTSRQGQNGQGVAIVRLRDVARIELGSQQYDQSCTLDGRAVGGPVDLPASRLQRPGNRQGRLRKDARNWRRGSPSGSSTRSSMTRRRSSTSRSGRCSRPCATPSSWWPSSCWCSCKTGGRR